MQARGNDNGGAMPGIVGIVSEQPSASCIDQLNRMLRSMEYESFYTSGVEIIPEQGVYLGWTAWPRPFGDVLPLVNENSNCSLVLAGEVFPDRHVTEHLRSCGHKITSPDAGCLIHLYEEHQQNFLHNLSGSFAGVMVDRAKRTTVIFNDRFSAKRLFVYEGPEGLLFSTEAKAILAVVPKTRAFDPVGLAEFLTCGCTLGSHSLFQGIAVLPGASLWRINLDGTFEKSIYFNRSEWESRTELDSKTFTEAFVDAFPEVVRRYSKSGVPVGISLTGGLDSRMVIAALEGCFDPFLSYTFGSMYRDNFDMKIAREISDSCGHSHTELVPDREFLRELPYYIEQAVYRSDGYLGLSGAAEFYVNRLAREISPIRLTGNYGSELLRGVRAFKSVRPDRHFITMDVDLDQAIETHRSLNNLHPLSFTLFQQQPHQGYGRSAIESSQVIMRTPFLDNTLLELLYRRPVSEASGATLAALIISRYAPNLMAFPTDRGALGNSSALLQCVRRIYREFLFKAEYLANNDTRGWSTIISRPLSGRLLARAFIGRHKFYHFGHWLRTELSGQFMEVLLEKAGRSEYILKKELSRMIEEQRSGLSNCLDSIDKALTIIFTEELFF